MIQEIRAKEEFEFLITNNPFVFIHFWAEWNYHDVTARDILSELDLELNDKIAFASLDTDQKHLWDLIKNVGVKGIPAFAYFKNGEKITVEIGLKTKEGFLQRIEEIFN